MLAVLPITTLALAGCGSNSDNSTSGAKSSISILASTNVYGDIASAVAGDLATVTSVISSSAQDPHEYEASTQDRLAVDDADLVVKNGGGYDSFIETLLDGSKGDAVVLDAVEISGVEDADGAEGDNHPAEGESHEDEGHEGEGLEDDDHGHVEGLNEHVWYDFHAVEKVAEEISHELGEIDPDNAATYTANYEKFAALVEGLESKAESLRASAAGKSVVITEPVPLYLLGEIGLVNKTPEDFTEAVEEGADVPPRALKETIDLFNEQDIAVLGYNTQTSDATTEQVRTIAEAAGVPVVDFSETLPEGMTYVEWQTSNLANLAAALGGK